jgi:rhomboid protease GluP
MGFVTFVWGLCAVCYVLTLILSGNEIRMSGLMNLLAPSTYSVLIFGASGAIPVFQLDRWWTVLSASWLHGNLLHIAFNMYWIRMLAPPVAEMYGAGRMIIIYTAAGVAGFTLSSLAGLYLANLPWFLGGAQLTLGASAPIFGLLGALVYYGRRSGSSAVGGQALQLAIIVGIFGVIMPGIDNYAHAGGFGGGYLMARVLDPLRPERIDHLLIAVLCLGAALLSLVVSVAHGLLIS